VLDHDLSSRTQWRSRSRSLGCGYINFDPASRFPRGFPAFFWEVGFTVAFYLPAQVFRALAPALADGSLVDSLPGGRAKTGIAEIGISPSKPGTGEMRLSNGCIQYTMVHFRQHIEMWAEGTCGDTNTVGKSFADRKLTVTGEAVGLGFGDS
jgi:hypothetical protein